MISQLPASCSAAAHALGRPFFSTDLGALYTGKSEDVLARAQSELAGRLDLIFTSPPFPLNEKKRYGNLQGEAYLRWLSGFGPLFSSLLKPTGSLVIEIGNAWEPGRPIQSLLPYESLLGLLRSGRLSLCQEITYYNPARLPSPAQWVTVNRVRLKDATTRVWWMAKTDNPKANNKNVLQPYSSHMKSLLKRGSYNSGARPSEHNIGKTSFLRDNGGAIPPNLISISNTSSNHPYQTFCKENDIKPHPARMPIELAEFFIKFLTDEGDLVLDPFAGSNTTGRAAESLKRRWISVEADTSYAAASVSRFEKRRAAQLLRSATR